MQAKNNSNNMASILNQAQQSSVKKILPRNSLKLGPLQEDNSDNTAFRISKRKKDLSQVDMDMDYTSPTINQQGNLQRIVMSQSRKLKKVIEQLQITRGKVDELQYRSLNKTDGSKETIQIIRSMQEKYSNEIQALKSSLQQKRIEEHSAMMKQKQKSTALFLQVVRLGDALQKTQQNIKGMGGGVENRLQYLEGKSANNDKNLVTLAQRNSTGNDMLTEFADKVIARVQNVQNSLVTLGRQHLKDKQQVSRIDSSTNRIAEDLNVLIRNMQSDIQYKLQNRVSEMVNKLMYQKEQRMRSQDEIKKNLDFRERLLMQKQRSQKEQMESRYLSMDTNIRNQFMRKDESIKNLQDFMDSQIKSLRQQIQQGNRFKQQSDLFMKSQLKKIQQGFRKEYDMYKQQQSDLVTNMQQVIKVEIGARLNSDVDLKNLTNTVANYLATDLNTLKQAFNKFSKQTNSLVKQIQSNSAHRDSQLSHYIDQQISDSMNTLGQKYNKMKTVFTKLTQQFRTHLLTTEANRKSIDSRLNENQKDFDRLRQEVNSVIDDFYKDFEAKLRDDRQGGVKESDVAQRIAKLEQYINYNIDTLKQGLESNRNIISSKLDSMKSISDSQDIRQLNQRIKNIKKIVQQSRKQNQQQLNQLKQIIASNQQKMFDEVSQMKVRGVNSASSQNDRDTPPINRDFDYKLLAQIEQLKAAIKRIDKQTQLNQQGANQNFQKIHQDISIAYSNVTQLQNTLKQLIDNLEEQINGIKNNIIILQGEVKTSQDVMREDIQKLIELMETEGSRAPSP